MNKILAVLMLAISLPVMALDCNSRVINETSANLDVNRIQKAGESILNQGADYHIYFTDEVPNGMGEVFYRTVNYCKTWQNDMGGVKSDLIVFTVSPQHKLVGLYYGSEYKNALNEKGGAIKSSMFPSFKEKDFNSGLVTGLTQAGAQLYELNHPHHTDFTPLWHLIGWLFIAVAVMLIAFGVFTTIQASRREHALALSAQDDAQKALLAVSDALDKESTEINIAIALKEDVSERQERYNRVSRRFSEYYGNLNNDPGTNGLSEYKYRTMEAAYKDFYSSLYPDSNKTVEQNPPPTINPFLQPIGSHRRHRSRINNTSTIVNTTDYVNPALNNIYPVAYPVPIVEEVVVEDHPRSEDRSYSGSDSSYDYSSSSSDSSYGGSDSSFDSSSDSSSSGSDSSW